MVSRLTLVNVYVFIWFVYILYPNAFSKSIVEKRAAEKSFLTYLEKAIDDIEDELLFEDEEIELNDVEDYDDGVEEDTHNDPLGRRRRRRGFIRNIARGSRRVVDTVNPIRTNRKCKKKTWSKESCEISANGCGPELTKHVPKAYNNALDGPCRKHDMCYNCADMYGWKRQQCDDQFKADMNNRCDCYYPDDLQEVDRIACRSTAGTYWSLVKAAGSEFILDKSMPLCSTSCAKERGNPNDKY